MALVTNLGLSSRLFEKAFPFYVAFQASFEIVGMGRSFKKLFPEVQLGDLFFEVFKIERPEIPLDVAYLKENDHREFFFRGKKNGLLLRGELDVDEYGVFLFLGSPWVADMKEMEKIGLEVKDFAIHDPSVQFFGLIQQFVDAFNESRLLADRLVKQGKELREKEEQLTMALEGSQDGLWDWNVLTNDVYYSPRWAEILGYHYGELRPHFKTIEKLVRFEDMIKMEAAIEDHFRYGEPFEFEALWSCKGGKKKWVLTRGKVVEWNKDGSPLRMVGVNSDIDERKRAEENLKELHNRLIDAIEILDSGFVLFDKEERLVVCNTKYKDMYKEAKEGLVPGTPYEVILDLLVKANVVDSFQQNSRHWIAQKLAYLRNPGQVREEKLKDRWIRVSERRTREGGIVSLLTDITERVVTEESLKQYEEIVQSAHEGIISYDLQGVITSWNPASYEIYGYTPQEAVGQHISMLIPDEKMGELSMFLEKIRQGESIERFETERVTKKEEKREVSLTASPIRDSREKIVGATVIVQDITQRKAIEEELRKRDRLLNGVAIASNHLLTEPDFFIAIGLAMASVGEAAKVDLVAIQAMGPVLVPFNRLYTWKRGVKKTEALLSLPPDWHLILSNGGLIRKVAKELKPEEKTFAFHPDIHALLIIPMIIEGEFSGFLSFEDSHPQRAFGETEIPILLAFAAAVGGAFARQLAEEQLKASEERFRRVFDTSQDAIIAMAEQGKITMINHAAEKMFKVDKASILGQSIDRLFPKEYISSNHHLALPQDQDNKEIQEITAYRIDRSEFPAEVSLSRGDVDAFSVSIIRDITERKQTELQLALAREKEIDIGFRIQHALLLGKPPENLKGMDVAPLTIASQGVDGDFYDFIVHDKSKFDLIIGDVMGKGIPAALLGAATKSAFSHVMVTLTNRLRGERLPDPEEIVNCIHKEVTTEMLELETFMTICFARLDHKCKKLTFVDCGHPNTLHFKKSKGEVAVLVGGNVPLGFTEDEVYQQKEVAFEDGDVFLFYSDGITETRSKSGEFFGEAKLIETLRKASHLSSQEIVNEVVKEVQAYAGLCALQDDLTLVVVKIAEVPLQLEYLETLQVTRDLLRLSDIRKRMAGFCQRSQKIEETFIIEVELAANEVLTNIIRHATRPGDGAPIEVILEKFTDRLCIHFDYQGLPFQPMPVVAPTYDKMEGGGFGLYIIEMMVDDVVYCELEEGKQRITITKYL